MGVTVYSEADYQGKSAELGVGWHKLDSNQALNNAITSVRVPEGWTVELFDGEYQSGAKVKLTADTPQLPASINNKASSVVVESTNAPAPEQSDDDWFYFEDSSTGNRGQKRKRRGGRRPAPAVERPGK
ncbi:hypothetical protein [Streptosporangium saharense]|uniref:hypothetical protein n=1 Tax=Streptosporangium saharense TaxID=1706840 RepID=UPI003438475D